MMKSPDMLRRLDERYERERLAEMTFQEAVEIFNALWNHARAMGAVDQSDWLADLEPDLRIAPRSQCPPRRRLTSRDCYPESRASCNPGVWTS